MTDNHNYAFWGQSTGMTLESAGKEEPYIFLKCIKKKPDGSWEKFKQGEGKTIRVSLEEIIMVLQVLNKKLRNWTTYHTYKDDKTQISLSWENGRDDKLWINIGNYSKMLAFPQIELFRMLLEHILEEKIRDATISTKMNKSEAKPSTPTSSVTKPSIGESLQTYNSFKQNDNNSRLPTNTTNTINNKSSSKTNVQGLIKGETEKALLIVFQSGHEQWVPKSRIHSNFTQNEGNNQSFLIENWILEKSGII
jgi:hypothetical protein